MSNVVRVFAVPSTTSAQIRVVEHTDRCELIIIDNGTRRRRRLEPQVAKALIRSLHLNTKPLKEN